LVKNTIFATGQNKLQKNCGTLLENYQAMANEIGHQKEIQI